MLSRIQFGNAVHAAENVRSCGLMAQFADPFLLPRFVAKDRATTSKVGGAKIGQK